MRVYRIGKAKFAKDMDGEGARLNGGRWNHILTPCIYTSESRALALLEYSANVNLDDIPRSLAITMIDLPDTDVLELKLKDLPGDWRQSPTPASTKDLGTMLLSAGRYAIIKVPSVMIPEEFNYVLNPKFQGIFKRPVVSDFAYDVRIKNG